MLCDICKKNEATIHLTEITNNNYHELHLCEICAQSQHTKITAMTINVSPQVEETKSILPKILLKRYGDIKCPKCGFTLADFDRKGRLSCPEDYDVFKEALLPFIGGLHQDVKHKGKVPKKISEKAYLRYELAKLEAELSKFIKEESFEKAAEVRDKIKQLEKRMKAREKKTNNSQNNTLS